FPTRVSDRPGRGFRHSGPLPCALAGQRPGSRPNCPCIVSSNRQPVRVRGRSMSRYALAASLFALSALAVTTLSRPALTSEEESPILKGVIHVNFADAARQENGLNNIENILKTEPQAQLEVVIHGEGIALAVKDQSTHAKQ